MICIHQFAVHSNRFMFIKKPYKMRIQNLLELNGNIVMGKVAAMSALRVMYVVFCFLVCNMWSLRIDRLETF